MEKVSKKKALYCLVRNTLILDEETRDSDKKLIFRIWQEQGFTSWTLSDVYFPSIDGFMNAAHPKSIIECRRKLQREQEERLEKGEQIPEKDWLIASKTVRKFRELIDLQRGTHVYRELA